jgi:hypothetical protein
MRDQSPNFEIGGGSGGDGGSGGGGVLGGVGVHGDTGESGISHMAVEPISISISTFIPPRMNASRRE